MPLPLESIDFDLDFVQWSNCQAQFLMEKRWTDLDLEHLIQEVQDLGKSERNAITSQLTRVLLHLLKWQYQPQKRSDSWLDSISDGRFQIELKIEDSPSLQSYPLEVIDRAYTRARKEAAQQMGLALSIFPAQCPYTLSQILASQWLPN